MAAQSKEDENQRSAVSHSQAQEEVVKVVSDKTEEQEKTQDEQDKEMGAPAVETGMIYLI